VEVLDMAQTDSPPTTHIEEDTTAPTTTVLAALAELFGSADDHAFRVRYRDGSADEPAGDASRFTISLDH
jgi:hypothetical protein